MKKLHLATLLLHAHQPFIRHVEGDEVVEEKRFFRDLSDTYIPLLQTFTRLEKEGIPFSLGLVLSPSFSQMLADPLLQERFVEYIDRRIVFGEREALRIKRKAHKERKLINYYLERARKAKKFFVEHADGSLLSLFDYYQRRGFLEILTTAATHAFLPFLQTCPESLRAQIEVAILSHRTFFGRNPQGFWLPDLGWFPGAGELLRSYGFSYTVLETHGLLHAHHEPFAGTMAPAETPEGLTVFGRDRNTFLQVLGPSGFIHAESFRSEGRDIAFELSLKELGGFLGPGGQRVESGYKYFTRSGKYWDPEQAYKKVDTLVETFIADHLSRAVRYEKLSPTFSHTLSAFNAETFGSLWYEGSYFIEQLLRRAHELNDLRFVKPIYASDIFVKKEVLIPQQSTSGTNGYNEDWLDSSNDWTWRHLILCSQRMTDLTERFPDETGLKERTLNQAARELLLAQSSDWQKDLRERRNSDYARARFEDAVRNFITAYESLGGNYVSTDWLTRLEKRNNLFPNINYRAFAKKR